MLAGVHFCTESYILLIVWIALGAVFIFGKNNFSRAKNKVFVLSSPHMDY